MARTRPRISLNAAPPPANDPEPVIEVPAIPRSSPLKVIRNKCLDCTNNQPREVYLCAAKTCPLWPWRMGVRPEHRKQAKANEDALRVAAGLKPKYQYINMSEDSDED